MTLSISDLLTAVEHEDAREHTAEEVLRELAGRLGQRPVPVGVLSRLWSLGTLQAKIALAYFAYWVRSGYHTADENERRLNDTHLRAAVELLSTMSYLKGIAMKVGQVLATYPRLLPQEFAELLGRLHFEAPPMHFALIREHLRNELGAEPEERFAEFEPQAFAAASLGQVHRARLQTGARVAVKIQYPNIARTIAGDMRSLLALLAPMRLTAEWDSIRAQCEDVRQMLAWETDYVREADFLRRGRAVFREEDGIVVPRVYPDYSTPRVLTMDYLEGVHLPGYLATSPPQEERDRYGTLIMRASFRIAHAAKLWYADSNPGNYLFLRDGRLGVVDFGCCREFSAEEWDYYITVAKAHREGGAAFRRAMIRAAGLDPDRPQDPQHVALLEALGHWYSDYLLHEGPFDFGDEAFMRRGIELMSEAVTKRYVLSLPVNTWISRQLVGLRAIAHRLGARIDMKALNEQESQGVLL